MDMVPVISALIAGVVSIAASTFRSRGFACRIASLPPLSTAIALIVDGTVRCVSDPAAAVLVVLMGFPTIVFGALTLVDRPCTCLRRCASMVISVAALTALACLPVTVLSGLLRSIAFVATLYGGTAGMLFLPAAFAGVARMWIGCYQQRKHSVIGSKRPG